MKLGQKSYWIATLYIYVMSLRKYAYSIYSDFYSCKNDNFLLIYAQKHCGYLLEPRKGFRLIQVVLMSANNLCCRAKIRKMIYTHLDQKVGCKGIYITQACKYNDVFFCFLFFVFESVYCPFQDYFTHRDEPIDRWGETGVSRENHVLHPQAELVLSHMWPVRGSNLH